MTERLAEVYYARPCEWHEFTVLDANGEIMFICRSFCSFEYAALIKEAAEQGMKLTISREVKTFEPV